MQLVQAYSTSAPTSNNPQGERNTATNFNGHEPNIDAWQMRKTFSDKVQCDGNLYYWCPEHKYPGYYDRLYVTHSPHHHAEWNNRQD